ncbi:MAG: hypothetical protein LRY71_03690 [Bacillaceae bacterium]|nr:hypothetical protein [Bacillaceae bacterium]
MISIHLDHIGRDHLLRVTGGTKPHIGAAVVASYNKNEVTVESIGLPHHKEERLLSN